MRKLLFLLLLIVISFSSCKNETKDEKGNILVKVYDKNLYLEEVLDIIPEKLSPEDSLSFVQNYIDKWIKKQLKLRMAEKNLPQKEKNVQQQLEDYRSSLLIYRYEQYLIKQQMNTDISESDIQQYYQDHAKEFPLPEEVAIVLYMKFPKDLRDIYKVRNWYKSDNVDDFDLLNQYCVENAIEFHFGEEWVLLKNIFDKVPLNTINYESFLKNTKFYETTDSAFHYFVHFKEFRLKGQESPLQFIIENIKTVILNKRKLELIKRLENSMYDENIKSIEIYEQEK
ncbi:MAG: hypothetical protein JXR58_04835 [Bacteroidales bacterium]|nr:hypothetical protein [Bacteroidales bacterium]